MEHLGRKIKQSDPLVPEPSIEFPENYTNDEHLRMLNAVSTVFREAIRLEQPFKAWVE
jgi:hypothetical protein